MASLLVVDDDPRQLQIWRMLFEHAGHRIHTAETAVEALRLLSEVEPDILLMDLRIPELKDGLGLIRSTRRARIIVLSGWPSDLFDHPEVEKVSRVFTKPVRTGVMLQAITEIAPPSSPSQNLP